MSDTSGNFVSLSTGNEINNLQNEKMKLYEERIYKLDLQYLILRQNEYMKNILKANSSHAMMSRICSIIEKKEKTAVY